MRLHRRLRLARRENRLRRGLRQRVRQGLEKFLEKHGHMLRRLPMGQKYSEVLPDPGSYGIPSDLHRYLRPWEAPAFLQSIASGVLENTMLPPLKIYMLLRLLMQTRSLSGAVLEAGVWNGGSARLMADYLDSIGSSKHLWLLDTFEGYDAVDSKKDGALAQRGQMKGKSVDEVKALFAQTRTPVHFIKGSIPGTLGTLEVPEISFAHIDVNLYDPTLHATEFSLERMPKGGIILFDDYNWPATYSARRAIDEACVKFGQQTISIPESSQAFLIRN